MASITKENLKLMTARIRANLQAIAKAEDPVMPDEAIRDLKDAARRDMEDAIRTFQEILGQRRETFDDGVTVTGPES